MAYIRKRKKHYCINIDQCVTIPTVVPFMWTVALTIVFLFRILLSGTKNMDEFWNLILTSWRLWFYLSGPLSLFVSIAIAFLLIAFPVSYVVINDESFLIHRPFKSDQIIHISELEYIRFDPNYKKNWLLCFVNLFVLEGGVNETIEIRRKFPLSSILLSSSLKTYKMLLKIFKRLPNDCGPYVIDNWYIAKKEWVDKYGSPEKQGWKSNVYPKKH